MYYVVTHFFFFNYLEASSGVSMWCPKLNKPAMLVDTFKWSIRPLSSYRWSSIRNVISVISYQDWSLSEIYCTYHDSLTCRTLPVNHDTRSVRALTASYSWHVCTRMRRVWALSLLKKRIRSSEKNKKTQRHKDFIGALHFDGNNTFIELNIFTKLKIHNQL